MAKDIIPAVMKGNVKDIYLIGGCDGSDIERQIYKDAMLSLPKSSVVITLGCAKFRLTGAQETMGNIPGEEKAIPRLLDAGQCNDTFSAL